MTKKIYLWNTSTEDSKHPPTTVQRIYMFGTKKSLTKLTSDALYAWWPTENAFEILLIFCIDLRFDCAGAPITLNKYFYEYIYQDDFRKVSQNVWCRKKCGLYSAFLCKYFENSNITMELFVQLRYNFDQYPQSKMYTGEIITGAITLPDSFPPVK